MLPIEKIVAIVIFLIILIVLIIFTEIPKVIGGQINLQQELRKCCEAYVGRGCPDTLFGIRCNSKSLNDLSTELGLDINQTKNFCNCPANKTYG
jgi:hypothetical protein